MANLKRKKLKLQTKSVEVPPELPCICIEDVLDQKQLAIGGFGQLSTATYCKFVKNFHIN